MVVVDLLGNPRRSESVIDVFESFLAIYSLVCFVSPNPPVCVPGIYLRL